MTDCVIYTRVSSKEQEEGFSLAAQIDLLRRYAVEKGFQVVQEYQEVESAKAPGRPKFKLMLDYLKVNPETVVLVEKTDRLFRNLKDYLTIEDLKVTVHFVKEGQVYGPGVNSSDRLMQGMKVLMARQFIDNLREEVKKGMVKRAEAGKWSCKAPYGYRSNPDTHSLEIDRAEAAGIKWLFETYATGDCSLKELASEFRLKGFTWRFARPMYPTLAHKMLNNPIYMGVVRWGDIISQGEHEPIIDAALWQKVQDTIHQRSRPKAHKHEFAFRGLVRCGHCGCLMTGSINKGHHYYKCSNARGKCTGNGYVREDKLDGMFTRSLKKIRLSDTDCRLMISAIRDFKRNEVVDRGKEIGRLSKETSRLKGKIDQAYDDYQDGKIDRDTWQRAHQRHSSKLSEVRGRIQLTEKPGPTLYDHAERLINTAMSASGQFSTGNPDKKKAILKAVVSNCTMTSGNLHYSYKKPFDIFAEGSNSPGWWS